MFAIGASAQSGGTGALLDETYQFTDDGDGLFRYVFAYDKNKQRSSETIYYKERNAGVWGSESLYEVGNYSYQFDSKGRLKVKEVKYTLGKPKFQTYRIMVDYNDNAAAGEAVSTFKRYTLTNDNNYQLEEQWSLYANGQLASHSILNSYDAVSFRYDENGTRNAILSYDFSGDKLVTEVTKSGTLNDSTIVHYKDGMPSWTERYRYDGKTGRPLEYTTWGKTVDAFHNVWKYDAQGRSCSTNITLTAQTMKWIIRQSQPCRASAVSVPACRSWVQAGRKRFPMPARQMPLRAGTVKSRL